MDKTIAEIRILKQGVYSTSNDCWGFNLINNSNYLHKFNAFDSPERDQSQVKTITIIGFDEQKKVNKILTGKHIGIIPRFFLREFIEDWQLSEVE